MIQGSGKKCRNYFFQKLAMNKQTTKCYLCGSNLKKRDISRDHVPPRQFYAKEIRLKHKPNLFTLPVHKTCNVSYQKDEDYFVHSIAIAAMESYSGREMLKDIAARFSRPQGLKIGKMVDKEFDERPSGLYLPGNKVIKNFDPERVWRVVWKITRGLFYKEYGRFLPEDTPRNFNIVSVGDQPPPEFEAVRDTPSKGQYPGVFDYKCICVPELNNFHYWAMLLWDRLILLISFHDPECCCDICDS